MREPRMNTAPPCYSVRFSVSPCVTESIIRNDEVVGSIPTSSTNLLGVTPQPTQRCDANPEKHRLDILVANGDAALAERVQPPTMMLFD